MNSSDGAVLDRCRDAIFDIASVWSEELAEPSTEITKNRSYIDAQILSYLSRKLNWKYRFREPVKPNDYGIYLGNGSWSGVVGMVQRKESDLGCSFLSSTYSRRQVVDFSEYTIHTNIAAILRTPDPRTVSKFFFGSPFDSEVWHCLFVWIVWTLIIFGILYRISKLWTIQKGSLLSSYFYFLASLIRQANELERSFRTHPLGTKLLVTVWTIFGGFFLSSFYCNMLTAANSVASEVSRIETLQELANAVRHNGLKIGARPFTSTSNFVKNSKTEPLGTFQKHFVYLENAEGFREVLRGKIAFLAPKEILIIESKGGNGGFYILPEYVATIGIAIAFRKDFPCKTQLNSAIRWLWNVGLLFKWSDDVLGPYVSKSDALAVERKLEQTKFVSVKESDLSLLLQGFVILLSLATVTLMLELLIFRCKEK